MIKVEKRNKSIVEFNSKKIELAIRKAAKESKQKIKHSIIDKILKNIISQAEKKKIIKISEIQELVENSLMKFGYYDIAKKYIVYRTEHDKARESSSDLMKAYHDLTFKSSVEMNDKRDNANINTDSPMGTMLKYGTTGSNYFADNYMLPKEFSKAHINGDIHIHDKDFYYLTFNCCQIDLLKLFKNGFNTGHGHLREPKNIRSYGSLACIAIQANQNDMFGGQSANAFDFAMAEGIRCTFKKLLFKNLNIIFKSHEDYFDDNYNSVKESIENVIDLAQSITYKNKNNNDIIENIVENKFNEDSFVKNLIILALEETERNTEEETYQSMEAVVHNFNSMHSRAGAQVPFSSLNFGTDISPEGMLATEKLLLAQEAGLGYGETPIFPILIFKMKKGVNYDVTDPGYKMFKLACRVSAKRLFPNFVNLDAPFNLQYYKEGDYNTEVAHMGCRTRTIGNVYDKNNEKVGSRGNISFVSINLPKLALESNHNIDKFFTKFEKIIDLCKRQLLHRFDVIKKKKVYNFPFLMGEGVWLDSEKLNYDDTVEEVLKHGSLSIGFVGLAEALKALIGKHHGESKEAQELGLKIIGYLREKTDEYAEETGLNFTTFATPAENLAGRFAKINTKKFGVIEGVTDRDYITNSNHVPVYYHISVTKKIDIEAPYHALTNAGHISYIEMDGDPTKNLKAFEKVVRYMHDAGIGYGSINHPVDRDPLCGYTGIIQNECPCCHRKEVEHKKITIDQL